MNYKIGDSVKIQTPGEKDETGTVITVIPGDGYEVKLDSSYHSIWFNDDGTEYRPRYGSIVTGKNE